MECPRCQYANADGARFCGECGVSLLRELPCASCGHGNPAGQKFCNGCGGPLGESARPVERDRRVYTPKHLAEKILTSRAALEGERKQVTVLFADVKGSLDLAEQLDPEEWHRIMDRFFQLLAEGVHRFEGTVNQYTGDGIMALFGAPIAHEDHAQRACYAALHLQQELRRYADEVRLAHGLGFSVRMGLNSGEVVVGKIGDDLRMDCTAQGHTVGLAARMEQMADPGKALLTGHTATLVAGYFQLRDLGATRIKGLSDLLHVFELEGVGRMRTRLDVSHARGFSRFVGRQGEMAALEAALEQAIAGNAQVIGFSPSLGFSSFLGVALSLTGRPREGAAELDRVIERARASQQLMPLYLSHAFHVLRCEVTGEAAPALAHGREALNYAERMGSQFGRMFAYLTLGLANILNGAWHDAMEALERALAIGRERRLLLVEGRVLAAMAAAHLGLGDRAKALAIAEEALAVCQRRGARLWECSALLTRIRGLREIQGVEATREIEAALTEADAWLEMSGATSYAPFLHLERAELARLTGDDVGRERALREAHRLFVAMGATPRAEKLAQEIGL